MLGLQTHIEKNLIFKYSSNQNLCAFSITFRTPYFSLYGLTEYFSGAMASVYLRILKFLVKCSKRVFKEANKKDALASQTAEYIFLFLRENQ